MSEYGRGVLEDSAIAVAQRAENERINRELSTMVGPCRHIFVQGWRIRFEDDAPPIHAYRCMGCEEFFPEMPEVRRP